MRVHGEEAFESGIVSELIGSLGWLAGSPDNYKVEQGLDTAELFTFIMATQGQVWQRLSDAYGDTITAQREFARRVAREIDVRGALDVLRNGVKDRGVLINLCYFRPGHTLAVGALDEYNANRLTVTRQLHYSSKTPNKSLDLALFVNGLPIATAELKNALTGQGVENAKEQYRADRDPRELIFAKRTLAHFAVDTDLVFLTTRLAGDKTRFLPFNQGSEGPGVSGGAGNPPSQNGYRTSYLWREIWQRDAWLELLERYLHIEVAGEKKRGGRIDLHTAPIIFPRFHQWHAVQSMVADARARGAGPNYLIEHSAGSGKSNTIAWLAHRLSSLHDTENVRVFDKVIVLTDRVVLDTQLQDTIYQFDHVTGVVEKIDEDSRQLAEALTGSTARIIITTQQKFPHILDKVSQLGSKHYAIVVDEAHSSQSGESTAALKRALGRHGGDDLDEDGDLLTSSALARSRQPNLSYFAFTATPKPKTLELFGEPDPATGNPRPYHVYSMRQAIDEGFILDVLRQYITYQAKWRLQNAAVDAAEAAAADPKVDPRKAKAKLVRAAILHPESQAQRAKLIVDHFHNEVSERLSGRAKAMVVTSSREHALKLYNAIRTYVESTSWSDCRALVAFSGTLTVDDVDYSEAKLNGFSEAALPGKFAYTKADDPRAVGRNQEEYRILVVAEKYQTGFDQPLLTAMYVDKLLSGVAAVQTLSRLNRIAPAAGKTQDDVTVLDLANKAEDIQAAFKPFFETTITEPTDPNLLYDKQREVMDYQLLVDSEMQAFVSAMLAAERDAPTPGKLERAHATLYRFLEPAVDRFTRRAELDPENAEAFRSSLRDYTRAYSFLAQIIGYADPDLERLYQYARHLANRLPKAPGAGVDIGRPTLSHFRLEKTADLDVSLRPVGDQLLPGFAPDAGSAQQIEDQPLSEVIAELNERFGLDLGTSDQLMLVQQIVSLAEDPQIRDLALMSDEDKYNQAADERLGRIVAQNFERNTAFANRYFADSDFQTAIKHTTRRRAYNLINNPARDQALRELRAQAGRTNS